MKNRIKNTIFLLATFIIMLALIGCTNNDEDNNQESSPNSEDDSGEVVSAEPIEPEELGSGDVKWEETETSNGYTIVTNEGGKTLAYSKDSGVELIQVDGFAFKDLNQDGQLNPYEDWRLDPEVRAENLASLMSDEQIAGLMLYSSHQRDISGKLTEEQVAMLDSGLRSVLNANALAAVEDAAEWNNAMQAYVEGSGLGIPVNTSTDPRDQGISRWPSNLALAATFDPSIAQESAKTLSKELRLIGVNTYLGPQIDIATEPRWTRIDGTFGEDPALSRDMTLAYVDGLQSTYDKDGEDIGWAQDSVSAMIKHWPGDGAGEGGRESHTATGNATVYPGGQFETHLIPFVDAGFNLEGETESAVSIMTSYSIAASEDDEYGIWQGTTYSDYKMNLLREQYDYDGVVVTDWGVMSSMSWGVEDLTVPERFYMALEFGTDQFGGVDDPTNLLEGYAIGVEELGQEEMRARFEESGVRLAKNYFTLGLFENPYVDVEQTKEVVGSSEHVKAGHEAALKSVVMLKNSNNTIQDTEGLEKPTVYIPMVFRPEVESWGQITPASWSLPVDIEEANKFFNVVTDTVSETLTGPTDGEGNPTVSENDIIRATSAELADVDYALPIVDSPTNKSSKLEDAMFDGFGYDTETNEYIPISLQYGPYTADSDVVREESISGDFTEETQTDTYGAQTIEVKENRSYYGKDAIITNTLDLDGILYAVNNVPDNVPVIVAVKALNPMIFSEFESEVDAILMGFDISDSALLEVAAGKAEPSALLPIQMPADMETVEAQFEDVPRDMELFVDSEGNTYDFSFGLDWSGVIDDERTEKYNVPALVSPENVGN